MFQSLTQTLKPFFIVSITYVYTELYWSWALTSGDIVYLHNFIYRACPRVVTVSFYVLSYVPQGNPGCTGSPVYLLPTVILSASLHSVPTSPRTSLLKSQVVRWYLCYVHCRTVMDIQLNVGISCEINCRRYILVNT